MAYTTINKSSEHFNTKLYTGNESTRSETGVGFQPDFTWIKVRSRADPHILTDAVRGTSSQLSSDTTGAQQTFSNMITSFNSDGFSLGANVDVNRNSETFASWNWKAGGGQGSSNTDGSINTTYTSVSTTAGFSISKYVGNDTSGATVGHGLGVVPKMIIVKRLSGSAQNWVVYHASLGNTKRLSLNLTEDVSTDSAVWNNTTPTSTVFTIGNSSKVNGGGGSDSYIAYCFAEKTGYSKFGSYIGNNNEDGAFVYTGFKPAFVMVKITDTQTDNWAMYDNKRNTFNTTTSQRLRANTNAAEGASGSEVDLLSNGFKVHGSDGEINGSGATYIYMAFAEAPLVGSNNVPCTAR